jgi:hypothetical protein
MAASLMQIDFNISAGQDGSLRIGGRCSATQNLDTRAQLSESERLDQVIIPT